MQAWAVKDAILERTHSAVIQNWVRAHPNKDTVPCHAYPDGYYILGRPPKSWIPGTVYVRFDIPQISQCGLNLPFNAVFVKHPYVVHSVRVDLLPLVRMVEALSSSRQWRESPEDWVCIKNPVLLERLARPLSELRTIPLEDLGV